MPPTLPPYALAAPVFRFRHLAALAGRAPIGGAREVALACFVAARLAAECAGPMDEDSAPRMARCAGAKAWLGTLALPAAVRGSVTRCAELTVAGRPGDVGKEVTTLATAASAFLDPQSKAELEALSASLRG
ncbi:MAG: hypothetical protein ABI969_09530 [bacterium]